MEKDATIDCAICERPSVASLLYAGLVKCSKCGLVYATTQPSDGEIATLYDRSYFHGKEYSDYERDKAALQKNYHHRIQVLKRYLPSGNLLEVGSAYGFFLELAKEHWNVTGVDVSEHACNYARQILGLDVLTGDLLGMNFLKPFDVFCMWDTIEHLRQPHKYIEKMSQLATDGSLLCLTTGDIGSLLARIQGPHWRLIHPPTHLFYFSRRTLARLLQQYGFHVIYVSRPGFYRSIDQILYSLFVLESREGMQPWIYGWLRQHGLLNWHCYLNTFDILYVIARYHPIRQPGKL